MTVPKGRPDLLANRQQRQAEILRSYAESPLGETLSEFCARFKLNRATLWEWLLQPGFREQWAEIQAMRRKIPTEILEKHERALLERTALDALQGDAQFMKMALEVLGLIGSRRQVSVSVPIMPTPSPTADDLEEILSRREKWRGILERFAEHEPLDLPHEDEEAEEGTPP